MEHKIDELGVCYVCVAAGPSLPIDCPGRPLLEWERRAIADGMLDFVESRGWIGEDD